MAGEVMLRSAGKLLVPAVEATLNALELTDADTALARLAWSYAARIDGDADRLGDLGPKLLATLQALQATPAARARRRAGGGGDASQGQLQALREARRA